MTEQPPVMEDWVGVRGRGGCIFSVRLRVIH